MAVLQKLQISSLRCIHEAILLPAPHVNVLLGPNGSGKTSVLEAIYLLGLARSFRGRQVKPLVEHGCEQTVIYAELAEGDALGVAKSLRGAQELRLNGRDLRSAADLAALLPLQLLNADTFLLLEGGPGDRRRFLDWGVFHVEHSFVSVWNGLRTALAQRNSLLRRPSGPEELRPWTAEVARYGLHVHNLRARYIDRLLPVLDECVAELLPGLDLQVTFLPGWNVDRDLLQALDENEDRDRRLGYSAIGPHRADLKLVATGQPVEDVLSRGQQKLLVVAMKLAQARILHAMTGKRCVYLIDDLPAELDVKNRQRVYDALAIDGGQLFITAVDEQGLPRVGEDARMFHVKHGKIAVLSD